MGETTAAGHTTLSAHMHWQQFVDLGLHRHHTLRSIRTPAFLFSLLLWHKIYIIISTFVRISAHNKHILPTETKLTLYYAYFYHYLNYCFLFRGDTPLSDIINYSFFERKKKNHILLITLQIVTLTPHKTPYNTGKYKMFALPRCRTNYSVIMLRYILTKCVNPELCGNLKGLTTGQNLL
ncbi:uncharacterized protein [Dermacentor andersoni]|uniref:uncharacterized protein n=1 Tax=Dermacentor andersoni TaxID=34620 RepID=UPI003B3BDB16